MNFTKIDDMRTRRERYAGEYSLPFIPYNLQNTYLCSFIDVSV